MIKRIFAWIRNWSVVLASALGIVTTGFSFIPEGFFSKFSIIGGIPDYWNETTNKIIFLLGTATLLYLCVLVWKRFRKHVDIEGNNYKIIVEYGNIFDKKNCIKVINFDECFTTEIGELPHQIKPTSLCGQFLQKYSEVDLCSSISRLNIKPWRKHSEYKNKECYKLGTIVPYNDFFLMAFGKLNSDGRAVMTLDEYTECLKNLWIEIDKYFCQKDVAITVLGSGMTKFKGETLTRQQLVDIIIASYFLSSHKLKFTHSLHIVCNKTDDFSLNRIGKSLKI